MNKNLAIALLGSQEMPFAVIQYCNGNLYFALRAQNAQGEWSDLSNNAFWPAFDVHLPVTRR